MSKQQTTKPFVPGANAYWRDDLLMVEIKPGVFVKEESARGLGISVKNVPPRDK